MATYQSSTTTTTSSGGGVNTLTFTKPTGLSVGDLLIAVLSGSVQGNNDTNFSSSGFTNFLNAQSSGLNIEALYKIADSGDVAASNFSFSTQDEGSQEAATGGILYRISGTFGGSGNFVVDSDFLDSGTTTPVFTGGVIPAGSSALLIMGAMQGGQPSTSSNYAVTNNNPSWTEYAELSVNTGTVDLSFSSAVGSYAAATTTGDYSLTLSSSSFAPGGYIIAISDSENVTTSPDVISIVSSVQAPTVTGGATVSPTVIDLVSSVQAPTVTTPASKWTNEEKHTSTWVNETKHD